MVHDVSILHLFSGVGGAALGFQRATQEFRGITGRFSTLAGIDVDPEACSDFTALTGAPCHEMDLFTREDYTLFHGREPGLEWREVQPKDLRQITGGIAPDVLFTSPPCKGFSSLLPKAQSDSERYQALNRLVTRGLFLALEAWREDLPALILMENVPRITSRGKHLLADVKGLLSAYGYLFSEGYHDCGELGGLAQHRRRYLLIARNPAKIPTFIYQPPQERVRSIGEVLGPMPLPDDPTAGPLHRLPRLQWKTWVRLALIPAGGDWRALQDLAGKEWRPNSYRVVPWDAPAGTVTSGTSPSTGPTSVADPRLSYSPRDGAYRIAPWDQPATTVIGSASVRGSNGVAAVADPRLADRANRHHNKYRVEAWEGPAHTVTGSDRLGSGAPAVADPRIPFNNVYRVTARDETPGAVTGGGGPSSSGVCVSDPRFPSGAGRHTSHYRVTAFDEPAGTVTGATHVANGAPVVADPRLGCRPRSGAYQVLRWDQPATSVTGAGDIHSQGAAAVADPRLPADTEQGVFLIVAEDGTWHRPLTTLELAALQGFPLTMPDGRPLTLAGNSDGRWRERIGNAVPPPTARAIGETVLRGILAAREGVWLAGSGLIWVQPGVRAC